MKKRTLIALAALTVVVALLMAGCFVNVEEGTGPVEHWDAAYEYETHVVNTTTGDVGIMDTFAYSLSEVRDDGVYKFQMRGVYIGLQTTEIRGQQYDYDTGNYTTVIAGNVECTILNYNITRTDAPSTATAFPAWYSVTIYRTEGSSAEYGNGYYWAKYHSWDSDGNVYLWENPQAVNETSSLDAYIEGNDDSDMSDEVIYNLYGTLWGVFLSDFGDGFRDGKLFDMQIGTSSYTHSTDKTTRTVGSYTFEAWDIKTKIKSDSDSFTNEAFICVSLPIPLQFQWKSTDGSSTTSYKYELTDITFR